MRRLRKKLCSPHVCGQEHIFWVDADKYCTPENLYSSFEFNKTNLPGEFVARNRDRLHTLCPLLENHIFLDFYSNVLNEIDYLSPKYDPVFAIVAPSTVITDEGCKIIRTAIVCTVKSICIVTTINDVSSYHAITAKDKEEMTMLENLLAWFFFDFPKSIICTAVDVSEKIIKTKAETEYHARMFLSKPDLLTLTLINVMALPNQTPIVHTLYAHESLYQLSKTMIKKGSTSYFTPYFFSHMQVELNVRAPILPHEEMVISPFDQEAFQWGHVALYARQHDRFSIMCMFEKMIKANHASLVRAVNKINYQGRKAAMEKNYQAFWDVTQDMWFFGDNVPCEQCLINRIKLKYEPFSFGDHVDTIKTLIETEININELVVQRFQRTSKKTAQQEVDDIMETFFKDEKVKPPSNKHLSPKKKKNKPCKVVIYEEEEEEEQDTPETPPKMPPPKDGSIFIPPSRNYISPWGPIGKKM